MKNSNFNWASIMVAILLFAFSTACNKQGQQEENTAEGEETAVTENGAATAGEPAFIADYMDIKNALVNDNHEKVKQEASEMQQSLSQGENEKLSQELRNELQSAAQQIATAEDIKTQRQYFAQLSEKLYQAVQNNKLTDKTLYMAHCPMALNNQGANWLSFEEKISNPYMGQRMPGCGSVQKTIQ